ncbi:uncharacterized protein LOC124425319 [Vespa crabro]|uniref:uncharacterized protein LOC124425319 n=1 Tax=Vespa crabro TaxID=7445 RepID=UPI001EFFDF48|nr:uncharacterized protein LOC124425319 [Vespa crabro]
MAYKSFLLLILIPMIGYATKITKIDMTEYMSSYYDPMTGLELNGKPEDVERSPNQLPKLIFRGIPCFCNNMTCGCCTGVNITRINFNRRACTKFTYDPQEFSINMSFSMNEKEIFSSSLSAKNPPPVCIPFVYIPVITFCARFFDVHTTGINLHACLDLETRIVNAPILILHFNCMKIGMNGVSLSKPEDDLILSSTSNQNEKDEVYDEVNFEQLDIDVVTNNVLGTTYSPEEEAAIGQLKY